MNEISAKRSLESRVTGRRGRAFSVFVGVALLATSALYAFAAFDIVFVQTFGPRLAALSEGLGWGVHSGDALALPVGALAVGTLAAGAMLLQRGLQRTR